MSLTLQPANTQADLALGNLTAELLTAANSYARFDLAIDLIEAPDGLEISLEYSTELFDADRIERLLDHYLAALTHGLTSAETPVDDINIMSSTEQHQVLHTWNPAPIERIPGLLHQVIAGHDPESVAVRLYGGDCAVNGVSGLTRRPAGRRERCRDDNDTA